MINYDDLKLRQIYFPEGMAKFLEDAHKEQCKKSYMPYAVFSGEFLQKLKDKVNK